MGLQKELIVNFQRITEIEIEKRVYVHTYNILPHLGPRVLDYSPTDHSREYWEGAPSVLGPRVLGIMYTSAEGNSLEIGTFPHYWSVHSPHG